MHSSPDLTLKEIQKTIPYPPRYTHKPHLLTTGLSGDGNEGVNNGENIYEAVGARSLPALPDEVDYEPPLCPLPAEAGYEPPLHPLPDEVDYEPNGYILRLDSIPDIKPALLGKAYVPYVISKNGVCISGNSAYYLGQH